MRFLVLIGVVLSFATTGAAQGQDGFQGPVPYSESGWASALEANSEGSGLAPTGWLIDFRDDTSLDVMANVLSFIGHRLGSKTRPGSGQRVVVPSLSDRFKQWLRQSEYVESVEPNQILSLFQEAPSEPPRGKIENPDDPMYASQWHFDMIHLEDAWKNADGEDVIVAVIDTGVSFGKLDGKKSKYPRVPDLRQTKFVAGYNFVDKNDDPADGNGHGTHVAGTIAQSTNNGIGVAGIAPRAAIMPIKVLSDRGSGSLGDISKGIRFAADHGAHVINMSLGGGFYSPSMHRAIKYAHDKGVTVVCAAGNTGKPRVEYPARYPECLAVSAVGPDGQLAFYSSHGEQIAVAAPGGDTRVDLNEDGLPDGVLQDTIAQGDPTQHGYFPFQGTSMATPHVAGVAALLVSMGITDPDAVRAMIMKSSESRSDQLKYGAGLLDAGKAVSEASQTGTLIAGFLVFCLGAAAVRRRGRLISSNLQVAGLFAIGLWFSGAMTWSTLSFMNSPLTLPLHWFGPSHHLHPLICNALWLLLPMVLLWGVKKAKLPLAAVGLGTASYFLAQAISGHVDVSWIPGHSLLDTLWLFLNGMLSLGIAAFVWRFSSESR